MIEAYCFDVQIYRTESGKWEYQISQEFEGDGDSEWELLESGECDTLQDAAATVSSNMRTLFTA